MQAIKNLEAENDLEEFISMKVEKESIGKKSLFMIDINK